jgi:deferrochelatase/peroxidase EfeB
MVKSRFTEDDERDTQALVRTAFDELRCNLLLLRIEHAARARPWLRAQRSQLACVQQIGRGKPRVTATRQIALTGAGLRAFGVPGGVLDQFAPEFTIGLGDDPSRCRRLGDIGANAPSRWAWGVGGREPHVLLMVFADKNEGGASAAQAEADARAAGLAVIADLPTGGMDGIEPFGFKDGVSQPAIDWHGEREPGANADMDYPNLIALGEFLLGYRNEYGLYTERPLLDPRTAGTEELPVAEDEPGLRDLGRNGSYLVFRQLHQNVNLFWRWVYQAARSDDARAVALAEAMLGRHMSGEPFERLGRRDIVGTRPPKPGEPRNDFTYAKDRDGSICPIGAHIRRANPRTGDFPTGRTGILRKLLTLSGLTGTAEDDRIASARFHRLLRRGREYGVALDRAAAARAPDDGPDSGLHFICLNANPARQFEFVQGAWLASAKFAGMTNEQDPILGNREPFPGTQTTNRFTRPTAEGRCLASTGLPQFVSVVGGAYFFLPGLRALDWLLADR